MWLFVVKLLPLRNSIAASSLLPLWRLSLALIKSSWLTMHLASASRENLARSAQTSKRDDGGNSIIPNYEDVPIDTPSLYEHLSYSCFQK